MSEQDECLAAQQEELLSLSMICGSDLELMRVDERAAHGDSDVGADASDVEPKLSRLVPVDDSRSALRAFSPTNLMSPTTPGPSRFANVEALRIRVVPVQEGNEGENHVGAYINAILTPDYPDASPLLNVTNIKGLDDAQLAELNKRARDIIVDARGYVVMFDVMVAVRDYLVANNKPEESLHDQMTSAKASKGKTKAMTRRRSSLAQLRSDSDGAGTRSGSDDELARAHRRHMRRERRDSDFSLSSHESLSEASSDYESDELGGGAMSRPLALSSLLLDKGPRYTFGDSESSESDDAYEGGDEDGDESERGHANESEDTANTPVANTPTYGRNKGKHNDDDDDDDDGRAPWRRGLRVQVPKNTFERGGASGHSGRSASVREVGLFGSGPARKKGTLRAGKKHRKKRRGGRRKKHTPAEDESTSTTNGGGSGEGGDGGGGGGGGWLGPLSSVVSGIAKTVGHTVGSMLEKSRGAEVWNMAARPELSSGSTAAPSSARDIPGRPESGSSTATFGTTPVTSFGTTPITPFGTTPDDSLLVAFHAGEETRARAYSTASTLPSDDTPCLSPMLPSREVQTELETTFRLDLDDDTPTGSAGVASSPELPKQHRRVLAMLHLLRVFARQNGLGAGEWRELVDHLQDIGVLDQIPQAATWDAQQVAAKLSSIFHDTIETDAGNRIFNKFWNANNILEETSVDHDHSRYRQDFVEVYRLGKGGGGTVFKVRNKLDGRFYAVKKVPLSRHEAINNKMLREVTTLSSLYHQHVVRYYQAWIEGEVDSDNDGNDNSMLSAMDEAEEHDGLDEYSTGTYSNASPALGRDNSLDWMFPGQQSWLKPEWVPGGEASNTSAGGGGGGGGGGSESPSRTSSQRSLQKTAAMRAASGVDRGRGVGGGGGGDTAGGWTESGGSSMVEWDSSTQGVGHYTDEAAAARRGTQLLYIQMEFCPMTLRDYISSGRYVHNSALYWRHFRQILGGLAHMHSKGIIHRDLKPCNIFFDAAGDLKIGDFGLATVYSPFDINTPNTHVHSDEFSFATDIGGKSVAAVRAASVMAAPKAASDDGVTLGTMPRASPPFDIDVTTGIGTWFYTSPEQMRGTTYNEKVDMYSLGIIFFEMVQPFSTMQERADMLDSLRDQHECPKGFVDAHITEASIINSLISREPRRRPSPHELLRSPILPAQLESEVLDDALKTIFKQIDSVHYDRMLENLFSITTKEDLSNKLPAKTPSVTVDTYALRERVVRHVKEVFRRVGAVPVHTPLFVALDDATMTANRVLDRNGKILFMRPTDQRIAFCNYCAEQKLTFLRRYDVNTCYKSRKGNAGAMKDYEFASYDILGGGSDMIADADVIKVTHSVLAMFRELGRATIRVSHMGIVKWLLERGKVPASKREDVLRHLASWRSEQGWSVADAQLTKLGVGAKARRFLGSVVGLTPHADQFGTVRELRKRFKKSKRIQAAADDLERLLVNLDAFGMIEDVTVDLSFVPSRDHYDGVVFECMLVARHPAPRVGGESSRQAAKRKRTVVGLGGRYDKLLKERYPVWGGLRDHRTVCGVTIDVGILVRTLERQLMQGEDYHLRDTMVLVVSAGKGLHTARLHVLRMLWGANIRAETMYTDNPHTPDQIAYCSTIGARVMVIIKEREWQDGHGSVWVRLVRDKERDVCVRMPDLIRTLSQVLSRVRRSMAQVHTNSTE